MWLGGTVESVEGGGGGNDETEQNEMCDVFIIFPVLCLMQLQGILIKIFFGILIFFSSL